MRVLTGNDLKTGDVVWWTGTSWSRHVDDAVDEFEAAYLVVWRGIAARTVEQVRDRLVEGVVDQRGGVVVVQNQGHPPAIGGGGG